jgi:photosystem II stability/assembly factor-like uncharacterized protein
MPSECGNLTMVSGVPGSSRVIAGVAGKGLWANNGGNNWTKLGGGAGSDNIVNRPSGIIYDPRGASTFWEVGIYNGGGVFKTTDGGASFQQLGTVTHNDYLSIDFADSNRRTLLAGGHERSQAVWKSTDGGETWSNIGASLPAGSGFTSFPLVVNAQTYLINAYDRVTNSNAGIYRTSNGGASWLKVSTFIPNTAPLVTSNGAFFWIAGGSLIRSTDKGLTWSKLGEGFQDVRPVELPDGRLVAVGGIGLLLSQDGGLNWRSIGPAFPYAPQSLAYSAGRKAFFISHWDCGSLVLPDAIMQWTFEEG